MLDAGCWAPLLCPQGNAPELVREKLKSSIQQRATSIQPPKPLDPHIPWRMLFPLQNGGVLVSTGSLSSELHAEDDSLASLNTGSKTQMQTLTS